MILLFFMAFEPSLLRMGYNLLPVSPLVGLSGHFWALAYS
jgi:hypothetical protein